MKMQGKTLIYILAAWLVPGFGHFLLRRWGRGLLLFLTIITLALVGFSMGGKFLLVADAERGMMYWFHQISGLGNGGLFLYLWSLGGATQGVIQEAVKSATFEYGVRFIAVAGLLNYLSVLDVIDISTGKKA